MKRVNSPADIPAHPHYAILVYKSQSVTIPGDERSRTCPGHGYPEHTEIYTSFEHYISTVEEEVEDFITRHESKAFDKAPYVVLKVQGKASVVTKLASKVSW